MKIDMSPGAVTLRLRQVAQLRKLCLALSRSSAGSDIQRKSKANKLVQRTSPAFTRRREAPPYPD
ncbi:MAG: hypothetical protein CVU64_23760 [Deltaproteobacteria bacterium HGW-Deltaproteobacteria-21]|nr:MAG: hypothetical protein CVU64_23760 [Deltaproteobacteria bacterium HGW-Deltaproteobacteria-21]